MTGRVVLLATSEQTLAGAAAAFLAQPSLARSTRRSYNQTLTRLVHELGGDRPLSALTVEAVTLAVAAAWGARAPATWNRHVATVRSFLGFSPCPNWSDCGVATPSESATRRCGGSCTRQPHAPPRP
jgi:hypothetical protein